MKAILVRFFVSPLGISVLCINFLLAVILTLAGALPLPLAAFAGLALAAIETLLLLQTGLGGRAVVAERDRRRLEEETLALASMAEQRNRLGRLRVADERLAPRVERLCLASGRYLEQAARSPEPSALRDPVAEEALSSAVSVVNDYLRLHDAPGTSGDSDALAARLLESLDRAAETIERSVSASAGPAAIADRQGAREELE